MANQDCVVPDQNASKKEILSQFYLLWIYVSVGGSNHKNLMGLLESSYNIDNYSCCINPNVYVDLYQTDQSDLNNLCI